MYYGPQRSVTQPAPVITPTSGSCRQEGCPCKDARVLNFRHLRFVKWRAEQEGITGPTRNVKPTRMSEVLLRPGEPENIKSEEPEAPVVAMVVAPRCTCTEPGCACDSVRSITHPNWCAECLKGMHAKAKA